METKKLEETDEYITVGLKPSTKLNDGHYEILNNLGDPGGFGITYLGYDCRLNSKVAIKEYFPQSYANRRPNMTVVPTNSKEDKADFKWGYDAFKKEAQTVANLAKHPNVIDVKNLFEENGTVYFVMSYAEGVDLETYLYENHPLTQKEIEDIIFPFLEGVKHIHKYNILHRDIKLANILITKDNQPILIDFGTARNELIQKSKQMTAVYTEGYASLEQHTQSREGTYTDIYAIGMLMYSMINGITDTSLLPSSVKRFEAMQTKNISLLTFPDDGRFSKNFIDAIKKALEIQKENRPQTVQELIDLLKSKGDQKEEKQQGNKKESKKIALIAGTIATSLIIAGASYYLYNQQSNDNKSSFVENQTSTTPIQDKTAPIVIAPPPKEEPIIVQAPQINHIEEAERAIAIGDLKGALTHLEKDKSSETPKGALRIAELYHSLKGEEQNAIKWYEKAEKLGYIKAQYPLAILYCKQGNFKKFNNSKGIFEYAKDSRKEFKYDIALCFNELGNIKKAREWFEASASMGYLPAKENLFTLLTGELGYDKQKAQDIINKLH